MKKLLSLILCVLMVASCAVALSSCGNKSDVESIKKAGKLVIGVTDYAPYDYQDGEGKDAPWIGFDADMARLVAKELGVEAEFVEIDWDSKNVELKSKKIDVIWNGMTISDDLAKEMDFSYSYAKNAQVVVVKTADLATYNSVEALKDQKIAAEGGSAGAKQAAANFDKKNVIEADGMTKALFEVTAGTAKAAVIDSAMAAALIGKGDYAELSVVPNLAFGEEEFAAGVRKGSDLTEVINKVLVAAYKDGTMEAYRLKYGPDAIVLYDLSAK